MDRTIKRHDVQKLLPGKLDHAFLDSLIKKYTKSGDTVFIGSEVGEDATVIDIGDKYLIAKTDPITFATDAIGYYVVHVNANDIYCMGGLPKWFLATILLPERDTSGQLVESIFQQIFDTCQKEDIRFCGGHTEITVSLERPIVCGQMLGEVEKEKIILKKNAKEGDRILLYRPVPIEAVSVIAREKEKELLLYFSQDFIKRCKQFLFEPGISVRRGAVLAQSSGEIHGLHDPTEGGLFTALNELAFAMGKGVRVNEEKIPIIPEARELCHFFNLNPLGCIASGSLLIIADPQNARHIQNTFAQKGEPIVDIGEVAIAGKNLLIDVNGKETKLPNFPRDEIVKIF